MGSDFSKKDLYSIHVETSVALQTPHSDKHAISVVQTDQSCFCCDVVIDADKICDKQCVQNIIMMMILVFVEIYENYTYNPTRCMHMAVLFWYPVKGDAIDTGQVTFYKEPEKQGHV